MKTHHQIKFQPNSPARQDCPSCSSTNLKDKGPLPKAETFAGAAVAIPFEESRLFLCRDCDLQFRRPHLSQGELNALYEKASKEVWKVASPPAYWKTIITFLNRAQPIASVLDVGCFAGDFLASLPDTWQRYGIEPNRAAAAVAKKRGISVVANSLQEIPDGSDRVSIITMFDVIEHVAFPLKDLATLRDRLLPGGSLIILTGATDSAAFTLFGNDYWYCSMAEHLSFFSLAWFQWAATQLGMRVEEVTYLSMAAPSWRNWFRNGTRLALFTLMNRARRNGFPLGFLRFVPGIRRVLNWKSTPRWMEATDHILIRLVLPPPPTK